MPIQLGNGVICPFCQEDDFDLQGLKSHLKNGWCDEYEKTSERTALFAGKD